MSSKTSSRHSRVPPSKQPSSTAGSMSASAPTPNPLGEALDVVDILLAQGKNDKACELIKVIAEAMTEELHYRFPEQYWVSRIKGGENG